MTATDPRTGRPRRELVAAAAATTAAVVAIAVALVVTLGGDEEPGTAGPGPSASAGAPSPAPSASVSGPSVSPSGSQPTQAPFAYQPLWPFTSTTAVEHWQAAYRSGGQGPWHLDADATALAFTTGYLGFTGLTVVVHSSVTGDEALVTVGYPIEGREPGTAAVLHLAKYGSGTDAPWEVVGSRDTDLTLTQPGYGSRASSPLTVGGRITGVDESIRVQVRQPSSEAPLGEQCCLPAGGEDTPWSTTVEFTGATAPALTVVASTGGHYTDVERFAITAVRL